MFYIILYVCVCVCVCDQWIGKEVKRVTNTGVAGMTKVSYPRLPQKTGIFFMEILLKFRYIYEVIIFFLDWPNMRRQREATV